ncbi:MAG: phage major capsid protein, partial [Alphaproteobacteria bacterium]
MPDLQEVRGAVDALGEAFEAFKAANDDRLAKIEKRGAADPVTVDKLNRLNDQLSRLETAIRRPLAMGYEPRSNYELEGYTKAFGVYLRKGEAEGLANLETKALSVGSDPEGGYAVTPEMSGRIATTIFESSPIRSIAAVETISSDALEMLVDKDEAASGWVGETATRTETATPDLAKARIPVHELYAEPRSTQKLLDDANFNVDDWLARKVADKFARDEATAFVGGTGVGQPRGFTTYPAGTAWSQIEQVNSGAASAITADGLISLQNALKQGYLARAVWVMKRTTIGEVRKLKDANNQYLWQPGLAQDQPPTLLGHRVVAADDMPAVAANALAIAFGDFTSAYTI